MRVASPAAATWQSGSNTFPLDVSVPTTTSAASRRMPRSSSGASNAAVTSASRACMAGSTSDPPHPAVARITAMAEPTPMRLRKRLRISMRLAWTRTSSLAELRTIRSARGQCVETRLSNIPAPERKVNRRGGIACSGVSRPRCRQRRAERGAARATTARARDDAIEAQAAPLRAVREQHRGDAQAVAATGPGPRPARDPWAHRDAARIADEGHATDEPLAPAAALLDEAQLAPAAGGAAQVDAHAAVAGDPQTAARVHALDRARALGWAVGDEIDVRPPAASRRRSPRARRTPSGRRTRPVTIAARRPPRPVGGRSPEGR